MGIWKSLFGKKEKNLGDKAMPDNFRELTNRAMELIGWDSQSMENEELYNYLIANGIPAYEAGELIIFLPTAFCRKMLPELKWPVDYFDYYSEHKKIRRAYRKNQRYLIIEEETEKYWNRSPNKDFVLAIVGRSAEFNAINQLLKLENAELTESYVIR